MSGHSQTVVWTALPNGVTPGGNLRLSVHVSARLKTAGPPGTLADFPDFLDWPGTAKSFTVVFGGTGPEAPATVVTSPAERSDLWTSLVGPTTPVKGHSFYGYDDLPVISYPVKKVLEFVQSTYTQLAQASPTDHPSFNTVFQHLGPIGFAGLTPEFPNSEQDRLQILSDLAQERAAGNKRANTFDGSPPGAKDFVALKAFHAPKGGNLVTPVVPDFDFHQLLALAGDHGPLLRLLGLVIDLEVPLPRSFAGPPTHSTVKVVPGWSPALDDSFAVTPQTRCEVGGGTFRALPRQADPELLRGHLPLAHLNRYTLVQVDPDGAGLKASVLADNLRRSRLPEHLTEDTPESYTVPSLRSGGLSVARVDRGVQFVGKLDANVALNQAIESAGQNPPGPDPELDAEDVTTGFFVDVWNSALQEWRSLTQRGGTYHFTGKPEDVPVPGGDEAQVKSPPTRPADPDAPQAHYLQESLFHWQGWSLAAEQPGKHIQKDDSLNAPPPAPPPFPLELEYGVPNGSLPRLRFGVEYRVRMRAADLSGNGVPFDEAAAPNDTDLVAGVVFRRFEPVGSPEVIPRAPRTEGEHDVRLVVRSNFVGAPDEAVQAPGERHVVPPKIAQRLAEWLGLFDTPASPGNPSVLDKTTYALIAAREAQSIADITTPDPDDPSYVFASDPLVDVVYLPDVFARGAALKGLPGSTGVVTVPFGPEVGKEWPEYRAFRIVADEPPAPNQEGPAAPPAFDPVDRVLHVQLPKAEIAVVRVSSYLDAADLDRMGVWDWIKGFASVADAEQGQIWLLTPFRPVTLVHAVRQPLATPEWTNPSPSRSLGDTFVTIRDSMTFNRKSTGKVEVLAKWTEPVDGGPGAPVPDPAGLTVEKVAFEVPLVRENQEPQPTVLVVGDDHEFGDTKHREVEYSAEATTKFAEYFVEKEQATIAALPSSHALPGPVVAGSVRVRNVATGAAYEEGVNFTVSPAGVVGFLAGIDLPATLEIAFIQPPISRQTVTAKTLNIPSSARPAAPKPLYAVPTFEWATPPKAGGKSSRRRGGGLRVYLERPWWSSGDGELLGVILFRPVGFGGPANELSPFVTQWGRDPLFAGPNLPARTPGFAHFPLSSPSMQNTFPLSLAELDGHTVNAAGHEVEFDDDRKLWFCDIEVDAGNAYTPFIRLALARFQPSSILNAHLSPVVRLDFVQLAPDRFVSVTFKSATQLSVSLTGISYGETVAKLGPGPARVIVEQRDPKVKTDLGWKQVGQPIDMSGGFVRGAAAWTANVTLPSQRVPGKFRLVIEQFEELPFSPKFKLGFSTPVRRRLVFSDIVPL